MRDLGFAKRIEEKHSECIWVSAKMALDRLAVFNGTASVNVLEVIRVKLEADDMVDQFIFFLVVCGELKPQFN